MKDFHIFNFDLDVFSYEYNYEILKAAVIVSDFAVRHNTANLLNYKDICIIAEAIYAHWIDGRSKDEDEKYQAYPWLEFSSKKEEGYIQYYAYEKASDFINLYLQQKQEVK